MVHNNAHPHFYPNVTGSALRVYARGYGRFRRLWVFLRKMAINLEPSKLIQIEILMIAILSVDHIFFH